MISVEIQLFTVISLAIALTGAAYTVVAALKDECKETVDNAYKNAPSFLAFIEIIHSEGEQNLLQSQEAHKVIRGKYKYWKWFLRVPMIAFCAFVLCLTVYTLLHKDPSNLKCKWIIFRLAIGFILVVDVVFLYLAGQVYKKIKDANKALTSAHTIAKDTDKRSRLKYRPLPARLRRHTQPPTEETGLGQLPSGSD